VAVIYLEADNPERALGELAASEAPFDYGTAERCASSLASIWRGYQVQGAASFCSPGVMMIFRASVRRPKKTAANEISR
jgi:hypothetical protein